MKVGLFLNIPYRNLLIRAGSPNVKPLTVGRIVEKVDWAKLTEEYSQLDFLKYWVKASAPLVTSASTGVAHFQNKS